MARRYTGGIKSADNGPDTANDAVLAKDSEQAWREKERRMAAGFVRRVALDEDDRQQLLAALGLKEAAAATVLLAALSTGLLWLGHRLNSTEGSPDD